MNRLGGHSKEDGQKVQTHEQRLPDFVEGYLTQAKSESFWNIVDKRAEKIMKRIPLNPEYMVNAVTFWVKEVRAGAGALLAFKEEGPTKFMHEEHMFMMFVIGELATVRTAKNKIEDSLKKEITEEPLTLRCEAAETLYNEVRDGSSLADLERVNEKGTPVAALIKCYRSMKRKPRSQDYMRILICR